MNINIKEESVSAQPLILLSGDNARTTHLLRHALVEDGFQVELAASYSELESSWERHRHSMVLLEVSSPLGVEDAINTALDLKRRYPGQFVGYLADPMFQASGLAGDAVFPRASHQLTLALRHHFNLEQS